MIVKAKDFRALVAELGSLTPVQRKALMATLASGDRPETLLL
jgi:hypothetical protein